ncbi:MAG TPA: Ig domain-containing protein [Bryobacteraceae bacterium]|nr:Ig domain-containing protein [Bryobacteraceae bacterium]
MRHSRTQTPVIGLLLALSVGAQPAVHIQTANLPDGFVGTAYSQTLSANGGKTPYVWSVTSGALPAGLSLAGDGTVAGTPSAAGMGSFKVQVQDASGSTDTQPLAITIDPAVNITTSSLPTATVGAAYSETLTASGGTPPFQWSVTSGSLPQGIALSPAGAFSGTPSAAGTFPITAQVKDSNGATDTRPLTLTVTAAVTITTASLPAGMVGVPYSQTLSATGGTAAYTWSVTAGALPAGLTLVAGGTIGGTPSSAGTANFTVKATSNGSSATKSFSIAIASPALTIVTSSLPNGMVGTAYQQNLAASGGTGGYTWTIAAGFLPAALSLSPAGMIFGTPSAAGTADFSVQVTDSSGEKAAAQLSIAVIGLLTITTSTIPAGTAGAAYSQTFTAQGGTPPYTWQLLGTLPPGLTFATRSGLLSGTPAQPGVFAIGIKVTDAAGAQASAAYSLSVGSGLSISTTALPPATVGSAYSASLTAAGGVSPYQWTVVSGSLPAGLNLDTTGDITGTPNAAGTSVFTVQVTDTTSTHATRQLTLVATAGLTITTATLPAGALQASYSQTLTASGGTPPYTWLVTSGTFPGGLSLQRSTGIITGTPTTAGSFTFAITVTDANSQTASRQFTLAIGAGLQITTSVSLPKGTAGAAYSTTVLASGGQPPYTWSIVSGALPGGLSLDPTTGVISGTPVSTGSFTFTVAVTDSQKYSATAAMSISIGLPSLPAFSITGFSGTMQPLQQPAVGIAVSQPYPVPVTGTLTLTFTPAGANGINDPSIQFSTGGRSASFTIPANATQATFASPPLQVQTGSVQGAITLSVTALAAGGSSVPVPGGLTETVQLGADPPSIETISVVPTAGGFEVQIAGVADTRDLTQATVSFQPSAGSTLASSQLTVPLGPAASSWFASSAAASYGGQFSLTLPFTLTGNASLSSVSVVLTSSAGSSAPASANY